MKEIIFISKIIYKNNEFNIYMIDGRIEVKCGNDVSNNLKTEVKNLVYSKDKTLSVNIKKSIYLAGLVVTSGVYIGSFFIKDINKLKNIDCMVEDAIIDNIDYYDDYINAINENLYLKEEDKKIFTDRYPYIEKNKNNINIESVLETLRNIRIERTDIPKKDIKGEFVLDENNKPLIILYGDASKETLIHEIYHALKFNEHYWDDVYYIDGKFIGSDDYKMLTNIEKERCEQVEVLGNMLEEAHTSILTASDNETDNVNITYANEVYLYKIYQSIIGENDLESYMTSSNKVVGFLNELLALGLTKKQVVATIVRLDLFNTLTYKISVEDPSCLKYQICDDLAWAYLKKYNNLDNNLLKLTVLSLTNNINWNFTDTIKDGYHNHELYEELRSKNFTIFNYLNKFSINKKYNKEYGVHSIYFDYFTEDNILCYAQINNCDTVVLSVDKDDHVSYVKIEENKNVYENTKRLYDDYYCYALNRYEDSVYAKFYAAIYANQSLSMTVDCKAEILDYYDTLKTDLNEDIYTLLMYYKYDNIKNYINSKEELLKQNSYSK